MIKASSLQATKLNCPKCSTAICFKCRDEWHGLFTNCERNMLRKFDGKVKFCPLCKVKTMKNDGCNHMTCYYCKYNWCWVCNGEGSSGHWSPINPYGCGAGQFEKEPRLLWVRKYLKVMAY